MQNEKLLNVYYQSIVIGMIVSMLTRSARHVARMGEGARDQGSEGSGGSRDRGREGEGGEK
jgi:hypothetical protein